MISRGAEYDRELAGFGFDGECWLDELREAVTPAALGKLGRYELIEEVSRGGQGIVYRARDRRTSRQVAVKRLVAGALATPSMRHRFAREIEAAAALQHANIVTLYGTELAGGQPLLVMQWIDGVTITEWATTTTRSRREIVEVFARVCDAVHHAHQRGVIHRDLKPSNILVDASDEPHVLDFGTAKLSTPDARQGLTLSGQFLGTPAYSSPEHVRGRAAAIDVRSDVYALGVVLYELLCGRMPYPVDGTLADLFDAVERAEPARPSKVAAVDHELEAIVLKALEKSPARRYQSVEGLGRDLDRCLRGEPVEAKGAGTLYVLGKAIRRHSIPVAAGSVVALLLLGYVVSMPVLYMRAESEKHRALMVQEFLEETLVTASPYRLGAGQPVTSLLDQASRRVGREFVDQPEAEAAIRFTIARAYGNLWMWQQAEPQARRASQLYRRIGGDPQRLVECLNLQARSLAFRRLRQAIPVMEEALSHRAALGGDHPLVAEALGILGFAYWQTTWPVRVHAAETSYADGLAMFERIGGAPTAEWARTRFSEGMFKLNHQRYDEAQASLKEALAMYETLEDETFYTSHCLDGLGRLYLETGRLDEAEAVLRRSASIHPEGVATSRLASTWWTLGTVARRRGDVGLARRRYRESLATRCDILAQEHGSHLAEFREYAGRLRGDPAAGDFPHDAVIELLNDLDPEMAACWRGARSEIESLGGSRSARNG